MTPQDSVWITGVGTINPLGRTYAETADNLLAGHSAIRAVSRFDAGRHLCRIAAELDDVPTPPGWKAVDFARLDRVEQAILWSIITALRDAGCWAKRSGPRVGLVLGQGAEWIRSWELDRTQGGLRVYDPNQERDSVLECVRRHLGLTGPSATVAAACASGNVALMQARRWIESGWVDVCLAGAADLSVTPMALASFGNLRALSRRNQTPPTAVRPFDRQRDGFVMGEGAAFFVLERAASARRRGAHAYAELAGCGASSDAYHLVIPCPDGAPAAQALRRSLEDAEVEPQAIDYINAHATGTPVGDKAEALMLRVVLGDAVRTVPVSSTKSMTGHLLSAASAVEAIACLAALERQALPPTINLEEPDPDCNLCHVTKEARQQPVQTVVSNSFGFGGSNVCVVFRRVA